MPEKPVLVTGATGFIGNYVITELLKSGCRVTATSANTEKARSFPWFTSVQYIPFRLNDFDHSVNYVGFFGNPDTIIHLAWEGLPNYRANFHMQENLPRHQAFLHNLVVHGLRDINVTGTCFEYGMQEGCLKEDMPAIPDNPYAQAKDGLRKYMQVLLSQHNGILKWIRLFYIYGKGQNPNSLFSQLEKALANGEQVFNMSGGQQTRDYLLIEQVAKYIVRITYQQRVNGIINCCSGIPVTVKQMVENYLKTTHRYIKLNLGYYPYPDYEPMHFWGDKSKLNLILNQEKL